MRPGDCAAGSGRVLGELEADDLSARSSSIELFANGRLAYLSISQKNERLASRPIYLSLQKTGASLFLLPPLMHLLVS